MSGLLAGPGKELHFDLGLEVGEKRIIAERR
jgi:hypothetical protein